MAEVAFISRNATLPQSQDFSFLRDEGLRYIQQLSGSVWTDYNTHDPGYTILEHVCYALTDLGIRTDANILDLLTPPADSGLTLNDTMFHSAASVLPNAAVTVNDYRKLIIDVEGVRNAWVIPNEDFTIAPSYNFFYLDYTSADVGQLRHGDNSSVPFNRVKVEDLKGRYDVVVEFLPEVSETDDKEAVLEAVKKVLDANRNLCEMYLDVLGPNKTDEVSIEANINLEPGTDPDDVLGQVFFLAEEFISPTAQFRTLRDMVDRGYSADRIYEGPLLTHGFLENSEMSRLDRPKQLYASDITAIIQSIPGVRKVTGVRLTLTLDDQTTKDTSGSGCVKLNSLRTTEIVLDVPDTNNGSIAFTVGNNSAAVDYARAIARRDAYRAGGRRKKSGYTSEDLPTPSGTPSAWGNYQSVQNELPETFATSRAGLPANATEERKAQARQLKGFLLFFDQILANYFAQLNQVKDLLSWRNNPDKTTYFVQEVSNIKDGADLFVDPSGAVDLQAMRDTQAVYVDRRNRVLDQLLARFSEQITDYSLVLFSKYQVAERDFHAEAKSNFLAKYPAIGSERGLGHNIKATRDAVANNVTEPDIWDTVNVPGYKKRVSALLGITDERTRFLFAHHKFTIIQPANGEYAFRFEVDHGTLHFTLDGANQTGGTAYDDAIADFELFLGYLNEFQYEPLGTDRFTIENAADTVLCTSQVFDSEADREAARLSMTDYFAAGAFDEYTGMHVVEHLLLFPDDTSKDLLNVTKRTASARFLTQQLGSTWPSIDDYDTDAPSTIFAGAGTALSYTNPETNEVTPLIQWFNPLYPLAHILSRDWKYYQFDETNYSFSLVNSGSTDAYPADEFAFSSAEEVMYAAALNLNYWLQLAEVPLENVLSTGGLDNPYPYQLTVVLPSWTERSRNEAFRAQAEHILRVEAPAHIAVNILWIDEQQMRNFEICYERYLKELSGIASAPIEVTTHNEFLGKLGGLRTKFAVQYKVNDPDLASSYEAGSELARLDLGVGQSVEQIAAITADGLYQWDVEPSVPNQPWIRVNMTDDLGTIYCDSAAMDMNGVDFFARHGVFLVRVATRNAYQVLEHDVIITIDPDSPALYQIDETRKYPACYAPGEKLAWATVAGGNTATAWLTTESNSLPPGLVLITDLSQSPTYLAGDIVVDPADPTVFQTTAFAHPDNIVIGIEDNSGNISTHFFSSGGSLVNTTQAALAPGQTLQLQLATRPLPLTRNGIAVDPLHENNVQVNDLLFTIPGDPNLGSAAAITVIDHRNRVVDLSLLGIDVVPTGNDIELRVLDKDVFDAGFPAFQSTIWRRENNNGLHTYYLEPTIHASFSNTCGSTVPIQMDIRVREDQAAVAVFDGFGGHPRTLLKTDRAKLSITRFEPSGANAPVGLVSVFDPDELDYITVTSHGSNQGDSFDTWQERLLDYGLTLDTATGVLSIGSMDPTIHDATAQYTTLQNKVVASKKAVFLVKLVVEAYDKKGGHNSVTMLAIFARTSSFSIAKAADDAPIHAYRPGDLLATVVDDNGIGVGYVDVVSPTWLTEESPYVYLYNGIEINTTNGEIRVADRQLGLPVVDGKTWGTSALEAIYNDTAKAAAEEAAITADFDDAKDMRFTDIFTHSTTIESTKASVAYWELFLQFGRDPFEIELSVTNALGKTANETVKVNFNLPAPGTAIWSSTTFKGSYTYPLIDFSQLDEADQAMLLNEKVFPEGQLRNTLFLKVDIVENYFDPTRPILSPQFQVLGLENPLLESKVSAALFEFYGSAFGNIGAKLQNLFMVDIRTGELSVIPLSKSKS